MEIFMDDITIYGSSFEECLVNLEEVLNRCVEKDLVLNWEKRHFMVQQGIVLGHFCRYMFQMAMENDLLLIFNINLNLKIPGVAV